MLGGEKNAWWASTMTNTDEYAKARKRAEAKYGFFVHAAVYAAVMVLLVIINVLTMPGAIWFIWPLIGWGFAVALHGMRVYLLADKTAVLDALTEQELRKSAADKTKQS
jgi:glucan phosphoethanolaminetransferase (alkaline phosphatase superfamily)